VQSARRSCKDSIQWLLTLMALFEMKTFSLLEMRMKMGLLRRMTGKLRRPLVWHHRHLRAQGHLNPTANSALMRNPTSLLNLLATLGDITSDQTIHY